MNWPQFLNPLTALIAAGILIPLLVALYFLKLRRQERVVSSTILWRKAIQDLQVNAPFQRLRRNLLLLLQLLLLVLLALALARPVLQHTPGAGATSVILIDRSASMSATDVSPSRLDEAKRQALDLVNSMRRGSRAMVIAFDDTAQTVAPFTTDTAALRRAIESIQPSDRYSRLEMAFQLADAQLSFIPEQNRPSIDPPDVWLYSDGKVLDSNEELMLGGNLKYVKLGSEDAPNVGIVAMSARRNFERPTEVQVFARLANFGAEPVNTDVQLSVNGVLTRVASVSLPPQRWLDHEWKRRNPGVAPANVDVRNSVEFTLNLTDSAILRLEHLYGEDVLASDNVVHLVVPPPRQLRVTLVSEGNPFLARAMRGIPLESFKTIRPSDYEGAVPEDQDLIIFDRHFPQKLPAAGSFMYFASAPPDSRLRATVDDGGRLSYLPDPVILDWRREHPILRGLALSRVVIADSLRVDLPLEAEVLVDSTRGPLMLLYRDPRHSHLLTTFDVLQSDWPFRSSFPAFLLQAVEFLALSSQVNVRETIPPGASPTIDRALINRVDSDLRQLRLTGPINATINIPPSGDIALPPLERVGLYMLSPAIPGAEQLAVNLLSAAESDISPAEIPPGRAGEVVSGTTGKARLELWWWIVAAGAVPLLLIEWWVYTRRVHL
jgi:hypothetical protein